MIGRVGTTDTAATSRPEPHGSGQARCPQMPCMGKKSALHGQKKGSRWLAGARGVLQVGRRGCPDRDRNPPKDGCTITYSQVRTQLLLVALGIRRFFRARVAEKPWRSSLGGNPRASGTRERVRRYCFRKRPPSRRSSRLSCRSECPCMARRGRRECRPGVQARARR